MHQNYYYLFCLKDGLYQMVSKISVIIFRLTESNRPFIKEHEKQAIRDHKYVGSNNSLYYHYCLNSLCTAIVDNLPRWLA